MSQRRESAAGFVPNFRYYNMPEVDWQVLTGKKDAPSPLRIYLFPQKSRLRDPGGGRFLAYR